jgi:hypothetical protein
LTSFAWDFTVDDQHPEGWTSFGEVETNWVKKLAEIAVARKAALREIQIQFAPDECYGTTEEMGYPWDMMDKIRDKYLRPKGLDLIYNKPMMSKEAWLKFCRPGEFPHRGNEDVADSTAVGEQPSVTEEEDSMDLSQSGLQNVYQGEDIRGYFISIPKADGV